MPYVKIPRGVFYRGGEGGGSSVSLPERAGMTRGTAGLRGRAVARGVGGVPGAAGSGRHLADGPGAAPPGHPRLLRGDHPPPPGAPSASSRGDPPPPPGGPPASSRRLLSGGKGSAPPDRRGRTWLRGEPPQLPVSSRRWEVAPRAKLL